MIDLISIALLIWTALAMVVDSHRESKMQPQELSLAGKIAVFPLEACIKALDLLGVVWNRVLYKQEVSSE